MISRGLLDEPNKRSGSGAPQYVRVQRLNLITELGASLNSAAINANPGVDDSRLREDVIVKQPIVLNHTDSRPEHSNQAANLHIAIECAQQLIIPEK